MASRTGIMMCVCVCVCCHPFILGVRLVDAPAGVTQEEGHTGFLHLPSAVLALRLYYTRLFPDPRFLLFVLQNIAGYKNAVECLLQ